MSDAGKDDEARELKSIKGHMVHGAAWMVSMRWSLKLIGVVNTVIIARLLAPDDFGVIAMAMIIVGFLTGISEANVAIALIRNANAGRDDYNSAWTIKIITGVLLTIILIALAPYAAGYYGDGRVEVVIQIIAFRGLINGFENIGVVDFRKNMLFAKEFRYGVYRRLTDIVIALSIVFALRDYHALAISMVVSSLVTVSFSFAMSSYRPWFSVTKLRSLWSVSQWLMLDHGSMFIGRRVDEFVIGGIAGSTVVGNYYIASEISSMPTREVILPAGRALIPTYAKVAHDKVESRKSFLQVFGLVAMYALPAGVGISIVAPDLVPILLGGQWMAAIPFFQWLGIFAAFEAILWGVRPYFLANSGERYFGIVTFGYACVLVPAIIAAGHYSGVIAIAMTRTGLMLGMVIIMLFVISRLRYASLRELVALLWRPSFACAAMWVGVRAMPDLDPSWHVVSLLRDASVGVILFVGTIFLLWAMSRCPDGPERTVISLVGRQARRLIR